MATLMLIDGNSLTYRAFFALPTDMATASGQVTNATFGFTSMLLNLVRDHQPDLLAVTFDRPEPTFRHKMVDTYKANRESAPDILRQQMSLVRQVVDALQIPVLEQAGVEADDIIATLATEATEAGLDTIIVTGDRDSYQLVTDPHVRVLYNRRGVSDYVLYDEAGIAARTGVTPAQYVQYAALRGDPSDNLPGVPGVGEKTAAKLITTYGDLDGIYDHLAELTPKLRENLAANEAQARSNVEMMRLRRDVELGVAAAALRQGAFDLDAVVDLFKFLEFTSLIGRLGDAFGDGATAAQDARRVLEAEVTACDATDAARLFAGLDPSAGHVAVAAAWQGTPGRSPLDGVALVTDASLGEVSWVPGELFGDPSVSAAVGSWVARGATIAGHDVKALLRSWLFLGIDSPRLHVDTKIAAYLLDPAEPRYALDDLLSRYSDAEMAAGEAHDPTQLDFGEATEDHSRRPAREALAITALVPPLLEALDAQGLRSLLDDVEMPLVGVLARMEHVGVGVDRDELAGLLTHLTAECDRLREAIVEAAGEPFNVNSTPQLRAILFDKLGLTPQKKTKTGYSTDAASLEKLRGQHPIIDDLLSYREFEKLRGTYGEGLIAEVTPDGRIHATFNQTVARTGRLSSDAPNLHNIPVRSDEGRQFRRAFVPRAGCELLVADYNQIELRCIAHLAGDPGLIEAFRSGTDIHTATASRVFGVEADQVTIEQRSKAKMVSYGLAYGMEAFGLGQRLAIPTGEAQKILDAYFEAFPAVRSYMDQTVAEARERGYTETLFGRRRRIPELASGVRAIRMAGERQAMNAGIQGLAADIFKVALVRIDAGLRERGLGTKVVLQVHDEVVCEVPEPELPEATEFIVDTMRAAFTMDVPLEVNLAHGRSWAEAKG